MASLLKLKVLLLLGVLLLASCSAKTGYRFLDWLVLWSVDDYIDFNPTQKADFEQRLQTILGWHQQTQLGRYSTYLTQLKQDVDQPITAELLQQRSRDASLLWTDTVLEIVPDISLTLAQLDDRQVTDMLASLDKKTQKLTKEYTQTSAEKLDKKRRKGVEKTLKRFIGKLTEEQKQLVQDWNLSVVDSRTNWLQNRRRWAEHFDAAMELRNTPAFEQQIEQLFAYPDAFWDEEYHQLINTNTSHAFELAIKMRDSLSDKQRIRLNAELDKWIVTFDKLAAE